MSSINYQGEIMKTLQTLLRFVDKLVDTVTKTFLKLFLALVVAFIGILVVATGFVTLIVHIAN